MINLALALAVIMTLLSMQALAVQNTPKRDVRTEAETISSEEGHVTDLISVPSPEREVVLMSTSSTYVNLQYKVSENAVTITGCDRSVTEITIPTEIDGLPVTSIASSAFSGCTSLTEIVIPDSVTSISSYAFDNCGNLTDVTIPATAKVNISSYNASDAPFRNCNKISHVTVACLKFPLKPAQNSLNGLHMPPFLSVLNIT